MHVPVLVIGAGPSGMMLAGELRLGGVAVTVVDALPGPSGQSRGIGLTTRTVEIFDQRGLLPRLAPFESGNAGHFGGVPLDIGVLGSAHAAARTVPQSATEAALTAWATGLGADLRRETEYVAHVDEPGAPVRVTLRRAGEEYTVTTDYLVGCDGGRSRVRKCAGFDFPGTEATTEMLLADLRGVDLAPRMTGEQVGGGFVMVAKLPDGVHRIIVGERGTPPRRRSEPPAFGEVADLWKRLTGIDISHAEPVWVSAFGDATRQVTEYRRGRVLLAGDAAHIHLPAGGQGMNTSIQDSANLGWKLAAVVRGDAPSGLLDTYHAERHEVGRRMLANTRAQSMLVLGGAEAQPLRDVIGELIAFPDVARYLAARVSGLDISYPMTGGHHPLPGRRLPHLPVTTGNGRSVTTSALLRTGRGLLLDLADTATLRHRAEPWRDRVDVVTCRFGADARAGVAASDDELHRTTGLLVRPDGHVAWAAPGGNGSVDAALVRWFGPALTGIR